MSDASEFRLRARAVRGAAREHLRELRAQRLARRAIPHDAEGRCTNVFLDAGDRPYRGAEPFAVSPAACGAVLFEEGREGRGVALAQALPGGAHATEAAQLPASQGDPELAVGRSSQSFLSAGVPETPDAAFSPSRESDGSIAAEDGTAGLDGPSPAEGEEVPSINAAEPGEAERPASGLGGIRSAPQADTPVHEEKGFEGDVLVCLDADGTPEPAATPSPAEADAPVPADHDADATAETDLYRLHGAGPGLVWMLEQCGIRSLQDLCDADAGALQDRLGLVGQILDVPAWIAFARERASDGAKPL